MSNFVCAALEPVVADDGRYRDYLSPEARAKLLREVEAGNASLVRGFGMTPFPPLSEPSAKGFSAYPGLSPERAKQLGEHHARIKRTAGYRRERATVLLRQFTRRLRAIFASRPTALAARASRGEAPQPSKPA